MNIEILKYKSFDAKQWALASCNLMDYLESLKDDFYEFQIQRRIVNNIYLNSIYDTIITNEPIPNITLEITGCDLKKDTTSINGSNIEILDGLQRSFRLWTILCFHKLINEKKIENYNELLKTLRSDSGYSFLLNVGFVNLKYLKKLFEITDGIRYIDKVIEAFKSYEIIIELWSNLTNEEVINKMLVLNAGQKSVSATHQFELLFLHFFDKKAIDVNKEIHIWREKEQGYFKIKTGKERNVGDYTMSSIIVALQSFVYGKPMRVDPVNSIIKKDMDDNELSVNVYTSLATPLKLSEFINLMYMFDRVISINGANYIQWFGKDTSLSGIYAGIGSSLNSCEDTVTSWDGLKQSIESITNNRDPFDLIEFNNAYNELSSTRVNVGSVVRKAIKSYTESILKNNKKSWSNCFKSESADND